MTNTIKMCGDLMIFDNPIPNDVICRIHEGRSVGELFNE